jgi:hypothetical protein
MVIIGIVSSGRGQSRLELIFRDQYGIAQEKFSGFAHVADI